MKRYGGLWEQLISWDNLVLAARKARRGKRSCAAVVRFEHDREQELLSLQRELTGVIYRPGEFRTHWITRPKPRMISAAPYRDRVVHHALMNVLEPILERHFHPDSYACRRGKGTHAAVDRFQAFMGRYRYAVHCDIRKYFPSIDHGILKALFRRRIKDTSILNLMDLIVDGSNPQEEVVEYFPGDDLFTPHRLRHGLPIGNLTSQWFANWYLSELDFFVTCRLRVGGYVRYCDDFIMLGNDPPRLREAVKEAREYLAGLRLRMHEAKALPRSVPRGIAFVGYRVWPTHRFVRKENLRAFRRRVRWMRESYAAGRIDWNDIKPRLASWIGHARQADSERLLRRMSGKWVFTRDRAIQPARPARRQLEQQSAELPVSQP